MNNEFLFWILAVYGSCLICIISCGISRCILCDQQNVLFLVLVMTGYDMVYDGFIANAI